MTVLGSSTSVTLRRKGYVPDAPEKRNLYRLSHELLGASPAFPAADSYEAFEGPILDQSATSSCTGHGTSQALQVACAKAGIVLGFRPSPRGIYDLARLREESTLTDQGAQPSDVVEAIALGGVRALAEPSPLGYASDCDASNVNAPPTAAELAAEVQHLVPGAYRVDNLAPTFIDQMCAGIHATGAAGIGIFADATFDNYSPATGPVATVDMNDPNGDGHWLAVTSYRTCLAGSEDDVKFHVPLGKRILRGPNSWGTGWGDAGHFEITEDALVLSCGDAYVFAVQPASKASTVWARIVAALRRVTP